MAVDISALGYFAPILAFLIVMIVLFALLNKTELLGKHLFVQIFTSIVVATIFVSAAGVREYVLTITPWFGALIVSLFFILLFTGFVGKPIEGMNKGVGVAFVIVLMLIFLVSGFVIFSEVIGPYLPGGDSANANPELFRVSREIYTTRAFGAVLLLAVGGVVSYVLYRSAGGEKKDKK